MNTLNFTPFPLLRTKRLVLRQMALSDQTALFALRSDESVTKYTGCGMKDPDAARNYIEKINALIEKGEVVFWAIDIEGVEMFAGNICLWNFAEDKLSAEVGYELFPIHHGKGIMSEALQAVVRYAFEVLKLDFLHADPHVENAPSRTLLERNDFLLQPETKKEKAPDGRMLEFAEYRLLNSSLELEDE